jgi:hypothetical protein
LLDIIYPILEELQMSDHALGRLVDAGKRGFLKAYEEAKITGFNPDGALQEGSKDRVVDIFDAIAARYGQVDLEPLGPLAVLTAVDAVQSLSSVLHQFESFVAATPADFDKLRDTIIAAQASNSAPTI